MPVEKVKSVLKAAQEPISLDRPIGEDEDSNLGDFIEDTTAINPAHSAAFAMLQEQMSNVLSTLTQGISQGQQGDNRCHTDQQTDHQKDGPSLTPPEIM